MTGNLFYVVLIHVFFFGTNLFLKAGEVIIFGKAPSYSGEKIAFYRNDNPVLQTDTQISTGNVDSTGNFQFRFTIDNTRKIYSYPGIFKTYIFVKPGHTYEIRMPKKTEMTNAEKLDPLFEEKEYHIDVVQSLNSQTNDPVSSSLELNNVIARFNDTYDEFYDTYARKAIYHNIKIHEVDSVINILEKKIEHINDSFFNEYKTYQYAKLKYTALKHDGSKIIKDYFPGPFLYHVPSYITLFNSLFHHYFLNFSGCEQTSGNILNIINKDTSYQKLSTCLNINPVLAKNEQLKEMVIIKNLYEGFYNQRFSNQCLFILLDSLSYYTSIALHKLMVEEIKDRVKVMIIGHEAPGFKLPDKDSNLIALKDFKGQYVYLNFCCIQSYECQLHFTLFDDLLNTFDEHLKIVSIIDASSFKSMKLYLENTSNKGVFLYMDENKNILKKYNVKAYPSYFLIDPSGNITISHSNTPDKGFSEKFLEIIKKNKNL